MSRCYHSFEGRQISAEKRAILFVTSIVVLGGLISSLGRTAHAEQPAKSYSDLLKAKLHRMVFAHVILTRLVTDSGNPGFALDLQNRYYDKDGKRVHQSEDRLDVYAPLFYNRIVDLLRESGLSDVQIKMTGLQRDKFFILAP